MNIHHILCTFALSGLMITPHVLAQAPSAGYDFTQDDDTPKGYDFTQDDSPAGYDFTEEETDPAEAEKKKKSIQMLIYNGAQYEAACRKAYLEEIVWPISACCDAIIGTKDLVECTSDPVPADQHRAAVSKIMANHPFAADSGQFADGLFSRAMLAKAKPNMSAKQYADIEHLATRAEMLMKWFMGPFAKACALHHYDFLKEVQRVARFMEYLKLPKIATIDKEYYTMMRAYSSSYIQTRIEKAYNEFYSNPKLWSSVFFRHFHNTIDSSERDQWLSFVVMGGGSKSNSYHGPQFGLPSRFQYEGLETPYDYFDIRGGRVVPAASALAAEFASYTRYFEFWSQSRIDQTAEMGSKAHGAVKSAADAYNGGIAKVAGEIVVKEDADFKRTSERILYALGWMNTMDSTLQDFNEYLQANSHFIKNRSRTTGKGTLREIIQERVQHADRILNQIVERARQYVPASDPSRRQQ